MHIPESQNEKDARVENLWRHLDPKETGEIDLKGLRQGLKTLNHPLKDANEILHEVLKAVDQNGDGKIQYEEFRVFVEETEAQLLTLFKKIDRDGDGKIDKKELKAAFQRANLAVPQKKLDRFVSEFDRDGSGTITFDEWRDFLLFLPADTPGLKAVLNYFSHTITVNAEGDTQLAEESVASLGYFLAGGISGAISRTATAPLDRLKVYLIANTDAKPVVLKGSPIQVVKGAGGPLIEACKVLWKTGGIRSLFAGNGLNVVKVMPESAIKFGSYEAAKRAMARFEGHNDGHGISSGSKFVAGGLGGMFSQLCIYPLDTLKFRMQCNVEENGLRGNKLIVSTFKQMAKEGFLRSSYRGLTMGLVGMFPYSAIDLGTFELCKKTLIAYNAKNAGLPIDHPDVQPGNFAAGAMGAFSGALGASLVYPINLLRTRLQAQGTVLHPQTYTGVVDCATQCIKKEGVRGLFKGLTPNLLKVVPAVSITYICYEHSKKVMNLR